MSRSTVKLLARWTLAVGCLAVVAPLADRAPAERPAGVAVLDVPGAAGPPVRFDDAADDLRVLLRRDDRVRRREAPLRRRLVARLVDQPGRPRRESLELAITVSAGDSGAPVVDGDGDVVGIVYARSRRHGRTAYAVRTAGTEPGELSSGRRRP